MVPVPSAVRPEAVQVHLWGPSEGQGWAAGGIPASAHALPQERRKPSLGSRDPQARC